MSAARKKRWSVMTALSVAALQALPEEDTWGALHGELGLARCTVSCTDSCSFTCGKGSCTHTAFVDPVELEQLKAQFPEAGQQPGQMGTGGQQGFGGQQ
jgi:hypothetical protein